MDDNFDASFVMDYLYSYGMDYLADLINQYNGNKAVRDHLINVVGEAIGLNTIYDIYQTVVLDDGEHDIVELL